jgi:5-formyltetrahydrofolate cyclo-ligase
MLLESKNKPTNKASLRNHFIQLRNRLSASQRQTDSQLIHPKLLAHPQVQQAKTIAIYISTPSEIDTRLLLPKLLNQNKVVFAPAIQNSKLQLRQLTSLKTCLPGQKGILEPPTVNPQISPQNIDVFIVPGLAFDAKGNRLGYGKGYYDRLLEKTPGFKIGIAFTDQLCFFLPKDSWDVRMHQVISPLISLKGATS